MAGETFKVEMKGFDKLVAAFEKAPTTVEPIMQQAIIKAGAILADHTDQTTVPFKTGNLIRSFNPVTIGKLFARWYPRAEYAQILNNGGRTPPRVILPKKGKALYWPGARHPVKKVNHPGGNYRPRKFMQKILSSSRHDLNELFGNALKFITENLIK